MKLCMLAFLLLFLLIPQVHAVDLLTNGDFEEPLSVGWEEMTLGSNTVINRATHYNPDPDYEAYAYKGTGDGYARLSQTVDIAGTDVAFAASAKISASATSTAWAVASLVISYRDEGGEMLGETSICVRTQHCMWTNTPTFHMIDAVPGEWTDYAVNVDEELANLPGVNPTHVKQIQVSLYAFVDHC
ncbi:MAG: hypothetical protein KAY24_03985 [Candidatus Eisenbacteria sp.]|nr:hypothetical protein [Candidatus Eisenbacteria bacterium]